MSYVDGFVIPLPRDNIEAYRAMAERAGQIWREHGALSVHECIADDVKSGFVTSFPQAVELKENEVVVLSWIEFSSRAARDAINEQVMNDPRMAGMMDADKLPFDGRRMIYGGFETLISY
jgi:uncharacterized protein YbaA (DUF1428 family)